MHNGIVIHSQSVLLSLAVGLLGLAGCAAEGEAVDVAQEEASSGVASEAPATAGPLDIDPAALSQEEKYELVLEWLGFSPEGAVMTDRGMVVEGDILILEDALGGYIQRMMQPADKQQKAYLCVGNETTADGNSCQLTANDVIDSVNSISLDIDPATPAPWVTAMRTAAAVWSSQHHDGQPVRISIDAEGKRSTRWTIDVEPGDLSYWGALAQSSYPFYVPQSGGNIAIHPGSLIILSTDYSAYSQEDLHATAMHEIGHALGWAHPGNSNHLPGTAQWPTNTNFPACGDGYETVMCTLGFNPGNFLSEDDSLSAEMLYPHVRTFDLPNWSWGFCSTNEPCDVGEGDCDSDAECKGFLICNHSSLSVDSYGAPSTGDVCTPPFSALNDGSVGCTGNGSWNRCLAADCPCGVGSGDCDSDAECGGGLLCGEENGPAVGFTSTMDVCVHARPPGCARMDRGSLDWNLCSEDCPCSYGEGDCDYDDDCFGGLVCGQNVGASFGLRSDFDLCVAASELPNL